MKKIKLLVYLFIIVVGLSIFYVVYDKTDKCLEKDIVEDSQPYINFTDSIYNTISKYYWKKLSDRELSEIYFRAFDEMQSPVNKINYCRTRLGVLNRLGDIAREALVHKQLDLLGVDSLVFKANQYVVKHLYPDENISEIIENKTVDQRLNIAMSKNPDSNPYTIIGVKKETSPSEILEKCKILSITDMTQGQIKSCNTLANPISKNIYDRSDAFSSVSTISDDNIFYAKIYTLSPTTPIELEQYLKKYFENHTGFSSYYLILDVRESPGGSIDILNYILDQFFPLGEEMYKIRSQIAESPTSTIAFKDLNYQKFDKVIILIGGHTESASEMLAEAMKGYNKTIIIGFPTLGNESASKYNYPIDTSLSTSTEYQLWLVNEMILRDDGKLIYHNGIKPDVDVSVIGWENKLNNKLPENVIDTLKRIFTQ